MMLKKEYGMILVLSMIFGLVSGALASFLFLSGPVVVQEPMNQSPKVISAEEFQLVDPQGKPRALLALSPDGEPYLTMLDRNDTRRVWLGLSEDSGLAVNGVDGQTRLALSLDATGKPSLIIKDR
ncbi:MAG TPA: hypothetical protein VJM82_08055 [Nitrospiraceae bacterium]|nr:hypothetical protein [Nitrospiraceae bacterium]